MKEASKRYLYNILGCFIMLLDIASIIIFCLEYLGVNCPDNLKEKLSLYIQKHDLNGDDYNLSFVFPGFSEKSDYIHTSLTIIILFIALVYIILVIICYILLMVSSYSNNKIFLITISIILLIPQIFISVLSEYFVFFYKNNLPDKTFEDFGELGPDIREAYDKYLDKMFIMKICSIYFSVSSIFSIISMFIIIHYSRKKKNDDNYNLLQSVNQFNGNENSSLTPNKEQREKAEEIKDFDDSSGNRNNNNF